MELNVDQLLSNAVRDGIRDGIQKRLTDGYGAMSKLFDGALEARSSEIRKVLDDALKSCLNDDEFRQTVAASVRSKLAGILVQRFGGELEKQVNQLKSDPATRARITLAI